MLRLQTRVVLVEALRLDDRVAERLEQRDAAILVGVGDVLGQRVDEELREVRFVALERALRRGDDRRDSAPRAPGSMSPLALVRLMNATFCVAKAPSSCAKSRALRSGPGMLILVSGPSPLPWPMSTTHDLIAGAGARRELRQRALDVDLRRLSAIVRLLRDAVLAEPLISASGMPKRVARGVGERLRELGERLRVLLFAAQPANDDQMRLRARSGKGSGKRQQRETAWNEPAPPPPLPASHVRVRVSCEPSRLAVRPLGGHERDEQQEDRRHVPQIHLIHDRHAVLAQRHVFGEACSPSPACSTARPFRSRCA